MTDLSNYPLWNPLIKQNPLSGLFSLPLMAEWSSLYLPEPIRISLKEKKDAYFMEADVTGVKKDTLKVLIDNDIVMISGDFSNGHDADLMRGEKLWRNEIFSGHAERQIHLDHCISPTLSKAHLDNGKLTLELKKYPESEPTELKIDQ